MSSLSSAVLRAAGRRSVTASYSSSSSCVAGVLLSSRSSISSSSSSSSQCFLRCRHHQHHQCHSTLQLQQQQRRWFGKKYFTKDHEYVLCDDDSNTPGKFGISEFAASELGDVVYAEVPEVGASFALGDVAASVESVKAASSVYAPVDCTVTESNTSLSDDPSTINSDAYGEGWMYKGTITDPSQLSSLMPEAEYAEYVKGLEAEGH